MKIPENPAGLLVVGDCQALVCPMGPNLGFPDQLARLLKSPSHTAVGYLKLSQRAKVRDLVRRLRPEILILQMGHFELTGKPPQVTTTPFASPFETRPGRFAWHVRTVGKIVTNLFFKRSKVDWQALDSEVDLFLRNVSQCASETGTRVILLSPLPCADPISRSLRQQAGYCFQSRTAHYPQVEYLDVLQDPLLTRTGFQPFFDGTHLSAEGHFRLAQLLSRKVLKTSPAEVKPAPQRALPYRFLSASVRQRSLT